MDRTHSNFRWRRSFPAPHIVSPPDWGAPVSAVFRPHLEGELKRLTAPAFFCVQQFHPKTRWKNPLPCGSENGLLPYPDKTRARRAHRRSARLSNRNFLTNDFGISVGTLRVDGNEGAIPVSEAHHEICAMFEHGSHVWHSSLQVECQHTRHVHSERGTQDQKGHDTCWTATDSSRRMMFGRRETTDGIGSELHA